MVYHRILNIVACAIQQEYLVVYALNYVQLFVTPWIVAHLAPQSMGFPRQEYCSGLLFLSLGNLAHPQFND